MPNFIRIGQTAAKIWRFNGSQNGGRPPSWICEQGRGLGLEVSVSRQFRDLTTSRLGLGPKRLGVSGRLCTAGKESVRGPIRVELQIKPGLELTLTCHSGRTDYDR